MYVEASCFIGCFTVREGSRFLLIKLDLICIVLLSALLLTYCPTTFFKSILIDYLPI